MNEQFYPSRIPLFADKTLNLSCLNSSDKVKTILLWNTFHGDPIFSYGEGTRTPFINNKCPVTNCEITSDKSKLNQSDFVLFHMRSRIVSLPKFRFSHQRWVYVIYESAQHCPMCDKLSGLFNLSATYKFDSDFTSIYYANSAITWEKPTSSSLKTKNIFRTKKNFAFVAISSCVSSSKRLEYIQELSKHMSIDFYGNCTFDNLDAFNICDHMDPNCTKDYLFSKYKFYLAFENSLCDDYITEKFFGSVMKDIIPVVMGAGRYDKWIPKSAYIDVFDFDTPKDLANYLIDLSENEKAYNNFFKWKKFAKKSNQLIPLQPYLCEMCISLQLEEHTGIVDSQLGNHYDYMGMNSNCYNIEISSKKKLKKNRDGLKMMYFESKH